MFWNLPLYSFTVSVYFWKGFMKENTLYRLIREIAPADSNSKLIDCNWISGMCGVIDFCWNYLQNQGALIQLEEKLQYKFINYLCVMRQETNDFVSYILRDFDLRKLPKATGIHFLWKTLMSALEKPKNFFAHSLQFLERYKKALEQL